MLLGLLALGDAGPVIPTLGTPTVSNVTNGAACTGGSCTTKSGSNDTIRVSWSITNPSAPYFDTKVYRDGVLKTTLGNGTTSWDDTAPGADGWAGGATPVSYVYRVDVVSKDDGTVVATATAATFNHTYQTTCPGPC